MHFDLLDLFLLALLAAALVDGLRRGFKPYAAELLVLVFALAVAFALFRPLASLYERSLGVPAPAALLGGFLLLLAAAHAAGTLSLRQVSALDRVSATLNSRPPLQAVPAVLTAGMVAALVLTSLVAVPVAPLAGLVKGSTAGTELTRLAGFVKPDLRALLTPLAPARVPTVIPQAKDGNDYYRLNLPAHLQPRLDVKAEERMLQLVNGARQQAGLAPLLLDPQLQQVARAHSLDMYERAYFSHVTPNNVTPFQRISAAGIRYTTAGENIAFAANVDAAEASLMSSPEHRANILNPDFRRIGIGVYSAAGYGEMFTQDFVDAPPSSYGGSTP